MRIAPAMLAVLLVAGCSDDGTQAVDAPMTADLGNVDAAVDGPAADGTPAPEAGADVGTPDAMTCFELSLDPNVPLAIDGTFDASSAMWRRPHDDPPVCPATALTPAGKADVPHVAYAFCNNDSQAHTFDFEMLAQDGPGGEPPLDDPYLFLYSGQGIPADPLQCLAVNDDIPDALETSDAEITGITVPPGGAITMVGTTYTFDPTDGTGTGYYILVVTVNDP